MNVQSSCRFSYCSRSSGWELWSCWHHFRPCTPDSFSVQQGGKLTAEEVTGGQGTWTSHCCDAENADILSRHLGVILFLTLQCGLVLIVCFRGSGTTLLPMAVQDLSLWTHKTALKNHGLPSKTYMNKYKVNSRLRESVLEVGWRTLREAYPTSHTGSIPVPHCLG